MSKRKRLSFILVFALVMELIPFPMMERVAPETVTEVAAAEATATPGPLSGTCGENITWQLTVDNPEDWDLKDETPYKLTVTGTGAMEDYSHGIYTPWNYYRDVISSISLSEGITKIGKYAFHGCASLKEITIPNSVSTIGGSSFQSNSLLEKITFGSGVVSILSDAFSFNPSLVEVTLNEGVRTLGSSAFGCCYNLKKINLPDSVTNLGSDVCRESSLETFFIPKNVKTISGNPVTNSKKLKCIEVDSENPYFMVNQDLLYEVKEGVPYRVLAYPYASERESLDVLRGTEVIGTDGILNYNGKLKSLTFPNTLKKIELSAISCNAVEDMVLPDSLEEIEYYGIGHCTKLKTVSIGKKLKAMDRRITFCDNLESIEVDEDNPYLCGIDNVVYNEECTQLHLYAAAKPEKVFHMPDTVEVLTSDAIYRAKHLKEVYMSKSLIELTNNACLEYNSNLDSIYFYGDALDTYNPKALTSNADDLIIYRVENSTGWEENNWNNYFPLAVWDPENTFADQGEIENISWKYEGYNGRLTLNGTADMPDFTQDSQAPWAEYMADIQTIESSGVANIGGYGFSGAECLIRLDSETTLTAIGAYAFYQCNALRFLDIESVESIGESALEGDAAIEGTLLLGNVVSIGGRAFKDCTGLSMITLGDEIETLEEEVFANCTGINYFIIPESVITIKSNALQGCESLYSINIPLTVNEIESEAFANATNLQKVYFYGDIPEKWESDSFVGCNENLQIYYRSSYTKWEEFNGVWNEIPVQGLSKFYTEKKDHYSFSNSSASFGYESGYRIPRQRYVDVLDISLGTYYYAINKYWKGSCYGMAATTLKFYEDSDFVIQDYDAEAENLYDISAPKDKNSELTKLIEGYQVSQYAPTVAGASGILSNHMNRYSGLIQKVEEFERSGGLRTDSTAEPIILSVYSKFSGHALIPVSIEQVENGEYKMKVYDCNYPNALQTVTINKNMTELKYGKYTSGSYINYISLAGVLEKRNDNSDDESLYLSINKENGEIINSDGKGLTKIKGAYEQKSFNSSEEDSFSGIRSFVVPEGSYQIGAEATEENTEDVEFYMASDDVFAQITSTDESTTLYVEEAANGTEKLVMESGSAAEAEDKITLSITNAVDEVSNVEVEGNNIQITVSEDEQQSVSIQKTNDEELVATVNGQKAEVDESGMISLDFEKKGEEEPEPTATPVVTPTVEPTTEPTVSPSAEPTESPVVTPTVEPTTEPTVSPSAEPTESPVVTPTVEPTTEPTISPSAEPSEPPVVIPTVTPEVSPSAGPSEPPAETPTAAPEPTQSTEPTPTAAPGPAESEKPNQTAAPELTPTITPSVSPSAPSTITPIVSPGASSTATSAALQAQDVLPEGFEEITGVKVDKKTLAMGVGEKYQIKAQVIPEDASNQSLDYIVYGSCIEVNKKGKIEALNAGTAKVLVEAFNGKLAVIDVTVKQPPKKISLNKKVKTLKKGKKFQIKVKFPKNTASANLTYKSSNKKVAKVTANGKVKALRKGRTVITVKTFNKKKAKMTIIVR